MEGEDRGIASHEVTQGRFEVSSIISHANPINALPTRLMRLAALPWFEYWAGQLRTEKKSKHTIRAYTVAARDFSTTVLPGEEEIDWEQAQKIPVRVYHERANPSIGRIDAWLNGLGEMRPATINARIAAVSHLLKWLGYSVPEWVQRPARRRPLPRPLGRSEVLKVRAAALRMEDPLTHPIVTTMLDTGLRISELCNLDIDDVDHEDLSALVIGGKGEKDRTVLFTKKTTDAIGAWNPIRTMRSK
ncbi:MAG: tyrosine-type recombinase/integrase, partial [Candidatus Thermoplasmatota archaeon]|nr:tyrosine-type recombinase/integrase [Candidatus Thermoplasmatota archaeon]